MLLWTWIHDDLSRARTRRKGTGFPQVTLSYAQFLDGSLTHSRGMPTPISSEESSRLTHRLRSAHDAILVGVGTVLSDSPQLNVRKVAGKNPAVVVLDSQLRTPPDAPFFQKGVPVHIFCSSERAASSPFENITANVSLHCAPQDKDGALDLRAVLSRLVLLGFASVMIEGGGRVVDSVVRGSLADVIVVTVAPAYSGGYRGIAEGASQADGYTFSHAEVLGGDAILVARR